MEIQEQTQGAVRVVKPVGALVEADAMGIKTTLLQVVGAHLGRVLVDLSAVPFIDSIGIESLLDVTDELARSGRSLKLCNTNSTIRDVLTLTGVSGSFEFYEDLTSGIRSFL